jgi:hypothetical protein
MEPTIVMLHTVLVCMLLIPITRFVRLSLVLMGLVRRRRISVVARLVLIKPVVLLSRLGALEMRSLLTALTLARVKCLRELLRNDGGREPYLEMLLTIFYVCLVIDGSAFPRIRILAII